MKLLYVCTLICMVAVVLAAGCTSPAATSPKTAVPTTAVATTPAPAPVATPITDPALSGQWYLKAMGEAGGTALVDVMNVQITANFDPKGNLTGFSGCNNYAGSYTLTGEILPNGKGITVGPLASTMMFCQDSADTERTYLQILQAAKSYSVSDGQLVITDKLGSSLIYQRTPYSTSFVPTSS